MLMDIMAFGCFLVVAGVMAAMWRFDLKSSEKPGSEHADKAGKGKAGKEK